MACGATLSLKRSLEFDPVHCPAGQHSPKRRRCVPMTMSPTAPPTKNQTPSPFTEVVPKLTNAQIAAQIGAEVKRMQRRKQIQGFSACQNSSNPPSPSSSQIDCLTSSLETGGPASPSTSYFNALSPHKKDTPLFTFKQVSLVCERMLKEREEQVREEYDKVLTCKLAEQYEAFLKFNHDQLHRKFGESAASYVS